MDKISLFIFIFFSFSLSACTITNSHTDGIVDRVYKPLSNRHLSQNLKVKNRLISSDSTLLHSIGKEIQDFTLTKDGLVAYSINSEGTVTKHSLKEDVNGENFIETLPILTSTKQLYAIGLSADEKYLAVSGFSYVCIIDLVKRAVLYRLTKVVGRITALSWDPNGESIALARASGDVFIWNLTRGKFAGENSNRSIEFYEGGNSPVESLIFHPAGRSFFVAEKNGNISIWRLIRAEEELGIRDRGLYAEKDRKGGLRKLIGIVPEKIEDMWLDTERLVTYASTRKGNIFSYKVRGLKELGSFSSDSKPVFGIDGFKLPLSNQKTLVLATGGRNKKLKFWCEDNRGRFKRLTEPVQLQDSVDDIQASGINNDGLNPILWVSLKKGSFLTFNFNKTKNKLAKAKCR